MGHGGSVAGAVGAVVAHPVRVRASRAISAIFKGCLSFVDCTNHTAYGTSSSPIRGSLLQANSRVLSVATLALALVAHFRCAKSSGNDYTRHVVVLHVVTTFGAVFNPNTVNSYHGHVVILCSGGCNVVPL